MATNLYHRLAFLPATESWEMPRGLESLAKRLVASGKLRINADTERNFVRYGELTFSARELTEAQWADVTRERIARHVAPAAGPQGIEDVWNLLRGELKKARGVSTEKEKKVARVLVQSAAPEVIAMLLHFGAEIYVSYAHSVADLMPVHAWQNLGENSGLQATEDTGAAIYVSCGGDPFFEGEQKTYVTDGFSALARMVVIAGQEFGHFADLRRNARGQVIGRYSTDINASRLRADPAARIARERDMAQVAALVTRYQKSGLSFLCRAEKGVAFYQKRWRYSPPWLFYQLWRIAAHALFRIRDTMAVLSSMPLGHNTHYVPTVFLGWPRMRTGEAITAYLSDMQYNLAPDADVYRHPDPLVEEAIAVIEAVARVPQQVHKWGFSAVAAAWPNLTAFYYGTILPSAAAQMGGIPTGTKHSKRTALFIRIRRAFRKKPDFYP